MADPLLASELESFRQEWINEARSRRHAPAASTSTLVPPPIAAEEVEPLTEDLEALAIEERPRKVEVKRNLSPVEMYELAVVSEREGRLNDGMPQSILLF